MGLTQQAHRLVTPFLHNGALAIDATAGNGHDTLFLASAVGPSGRVAAFDIQSAAIAATGKRLCVAGLDERVKLFQTGHERMAECLDAEWRGSVSAVLFNLGYLPGHNHAVTTLPLTTRIALDAIPPLLAETSIVSIMAYTGHAGGIDEYLTVLDWLRDLPGAFCSEWINRDAPAHGPKLHIVFRNKAMR